MNTEQKNLWILTEERPKTETLKKILDFFAQEHNCGFFCDSIHIIPILDKNQNFDFTYEIIGFKCAKINHIFLKTVSGSSSFVDYLVFYQQEQPVEGSEPIYAIEETKTDDGESRNTGVYQRGSKFVFLQYYYKKAKKVMLYSLQIPQKKKPTDTYIFGTRLLLTLGVEIIGKDLDSKVFVPFSSIDEIIELKEKMHKPNRTNVPITLTKKDNEIEISGRLYKYDKIGHDPNIGSLTLIAACLRKLGWNDRIIITNHGLSQSNVGKNNKFIKIANNLSIELDGLTLPKSQMPALYWHYDLKGEKLGTIFIHIVVESFTKGYSIFENHAGCEKSYFRTSDGKQIPLAKYVDQKKYKDGDKSQRINIPDLVLLDIDKSEIIDIEGKKFQNCDIGIRELSGYEAFDKLYVKKYYPEFDIIRTVVLFGGNNERIMEVEVGFLLNQNGKLVLGIKAPELFTKAIKNLLDYWN